MGAKLRTLVIRGDHCLVNVNSLYVAALEWVTANAAIEGRPGKCERLNDYSLCKPYSVLGLLITLTTVSTPCTIHVSSQVVRIQDKNLS